MASVAVVAMGVILGVCVVAAIVLFVLMERWEERIERLNDMNRAPPAVDAQRSEREYR